ncbi:MAG: MBL fold metallo-hydrolase [Gammaproteobacteria bacterium]|nr:MBL fold metallo-hydrolase [Gammaproteobacteria bacterium]MDH4254084.1 MBL fold metallo-hydrolase [Gammaproteobacteria bacterium]MDH5310474.1 MBL fold metallo-hydrolase [Gammaproteobacteria bacterium]
MKFQLQFLGATEEVTGSLYLLRTPQHTLMLECGLLQGGGNNEDRNKEDFPVALGEIDALVLSHSHIDHSGRIPLLVKRGYRGPVYAQHATKALCEIMLPDSGYLNEKDAEWENRKRRERGEAMVEALYTREEAEACMGQFESIGYDEETEILPGVWLRFHDAGHILGSSIVEIRCVDGDDSRTLVFSGDLGYRDAPVMNSPRHLRHADVVMLESTYGDRLHKPFADTMQELADVFERARAAQGNILIPAFTVGRTQDLLYLLAENFDEWHLRHWHIFLDSPLGIEATEVYARYRHLYGARLFGPESSLPDLPNYHATRTTEESMAINQITSGAIIIAGSGMCTGGRIHHHLKNNVWRPECHVVIVGYQAIGTLGRRLVDGADEIRLWGDTYPVRAKVHTIGGLSAHGDQADLLEWYGAFESSPPVYLVHGEPKAQAALRDKLKGQFKAPAHIATYGQTVDF